MATVLSENLVVQKAKVDNIAHVRSLNVWGMELADITILNQLPNLQVCSLSVNRIDSLAVFAACPHLQELYLRRNRVADLRELYSLQGCRRLRSLWLGENPVAAHPGYRLFAVKLLKGLTKLDDADITREERSQAERYSDEQILNLRGAPPRSTSPPRHTTPPRVDRRAERRGSRPDDGAPSRDTAAPNKVRKVPVRHVGSADPNARNLYNGDDVPIGGGGGGGGARKGGNDGRCVQMPGKPARAAAAAAKPRSPKADRERRGSGDAPAVQSRRSSREVVDAPPRGAAYPTRAAARQRYSQSPEYRENPAARHADPVAPPRPESPVPLSRPRTPSPVAAPAAPLKGPAGKGGNPAEQAMLQSIMGLMPHLSVNGLEAVSRELQSLLRQRSDERDLRLK